MEWNLGSIRAYLSNPCGTWIACEATVLKSYHSFPCPVRVLLLPSYRRQQAERAAANAQRLLRYEMIGARWAESGAGKKQHDIDVAEERRVLTEAARKEKADEERERVINVGGRGG